MLLTKEQLSKAVDGLKVRLCCERPVAHYCRDACLDDPNECDIAIAIAAMETLQKLLPLLQLDADIVLPVVRCKDCKYYNAGFECIKEGYGIEYDENYYCASAERREK